MKILPIKTHRIEAGTETILEILDNYITDMSEESVVVITSKIVSLCEDRILDAKSHDKEQVIKDEANLSLDASVGKYGYHFTIIHNTMVAAAGIDESNIRSGYLLWPKDPQATANLIREHLKTKHNVKHVGVVITDSVSTPLRLGTSGTAIAYSGFRAVNDYIGTKDLFGHTYKVSRANIAEGLAASAVMVMGEGTEQTPVCIINELPKHVQFEDKNPSKKELLECKPSPEDDLFEPFLRTQKWHKTKRQR
jgi:coenzyme F420-0:L-glutamate ligase